MRFTGQLVKKCLESEFLSNDNVYRDLGRFLTLTYGIYIHSCTWVHIRTQKITEVIVSRVQMMSYGYKLYQYVLGQELDRLENYFVLEKILKHFLRMRGRY